MGDISVYKVNSFTQISLLPCVLEKCIKVSFKVKGMLKAVDFVGYLTKAGIHKRGVLKSNSSDWVKLFIINPWIEISVPSPTSNHYLTSVRVCNESCSFHAFFSAHKLDLIHRLNVLHFCEFRLKMLRLEGGVNHNIQLVYIYL